MLRLVLKIIEKNKLYRILFYIHVIKRKFKQCWSNNSINKTSNEISPQIIEYLSDIQFELSFFVSNKKLATFIQSHRWWYVSFILCRDVQLLLLLFRLFYTRQNRYCDEIDGITVTGVTPICYLHVVCQHIRFDVYLSFICEHRNRLFPYLLYNDNLYIQQANIEKAFIYN